MDGGRMIEFDDPHILLQKSDGIFKDMVNALGSAESAKLTQIAADKSN